MTCEVDVNECATDNGGCGYSGSECSNLPVGSWTCSVAFVSGSVNLTQPAAYAVNTSTPITVSTLVSTGAGQILQFDLSAPRRETSAYTFAVGTNPSDPYRVPCANPILIGVPRLNATVLPTLPRCTMSDRLLRIVVLDG